MNLNGTSCKTCAVYYFGGDTQFPIMRGGCSQDAEAWPAFPNGVKAGHIEGFFVWHSEEILALLPIPLVEPRGWDHAAQ